MGWDGVHINGAILTEKGFIEGHIEFDNGIITKIDETIIPDPVMTGIVVPPFFNAHTHIGDSFIRNPPKMPIDELVGPGGYKHRMLESADDEQIIAGMYRSMRTMVSTGTFEFADFREGGIKGVELLKNASNGMEIRPRILSRPVDGSDEEIDALLEISDGFGMSSLSDYDFEFLSMLSERAHEQGKTFAIHFSERIRESVNSLLELNPDFIVHGNEMSHEDMMDIADAQIPVVICPRSNAFFGKKHRFMDFVKHGIDVHLGTDNAMIAKPDILKELSFLYSTTKRKEPELIRAMAMSIFERKLLKGSNIGLREGQEATFIVIDRPWINPEKGIINAEKEDLRIYVNGDEHG